MNEISKCFIGFVLSSVASVSYSYQLLLALKYSEIQDP